MTEPYANKSPMIIDHSEELLLDPFFPSLEKLEALFEFHLD